MTPADRLLVLHDGQFALYLLFLLLAVCELCLRFRQRKYCQRCKSRRQSLSTWRLAQSSARSQGTAPDPGIYTDIVGVLVDCVKVYAGSQLAKDLLAQRPQSFGQRLGARAKHWFKAAENVDKDDIKFDEYDVRLK